MKLQRTLGFWDVYAIALGQVIGSGIGDLLFVVVLGFNPTSTTMYYNGGALKMKILLTLRVNNGTKEQPEKDHK